MYYNKRGSALLSETSIGLIIGVIVVVTLLSLALSFLTKESKSDQIFQSLFEQVKGSIEEAKKYSISEITIYQELSDTERYFLVNFQEKNNVQIQEFDNLLTTNFYSKKNQLCLCSTKDIKNNMIICENCINLKERINVENNFIALDTLTKVGINFDEDQYFLEILSKDDITLEKITNSLKEENKINEFCNNLGNEWFQTCIARADISLNKIIEKEISLSQSCEIIIKGFFSRFNLDIEEFNDFYLEKIEDCKNNEDYTRILQEIEIKKNQV